MRTSRRSLGFHGAPLLLLTVLLACASCGGRGSLVPAVPAGRDFSLTVEPASFFGPGSRAQFSTRVEPDGRDLVVRVEARDAVNLQALYLSLAYDAERYTPLAAEATDQLFGASSGVEPLSLGVLDDPARVWFGCMLPNPERHSGFSGSGVVAEIRFAQHPFAGIARAASSVPDTNGARAVLGLSAQDKVSWLYTNPGDYDQNGEVNVADLTPLGQNFHVADLDDGFPSESALWVVDGDHNNEINLADLTVIGANFHHAVGGYRLFASLDSTDYPAGNSAPNGGGAQLLTEIPLASAVGGSDERKRFDFTLPDNGRKYWVRPFTNEGVGSPSNLLDLEVQLKGNGAVLPPGTLANLTSFAADGTLTFSAGDADLAALAPGDIVVGAPAPGAPNGLLRRVVTTAGGGTVLATEPAELTDLLQKGLLAAQIPLAQADVKSGSTALRGVTWQRDKAASTASGSEFFLGVNDVILADEDGDAATKNDQIKLDGTLGVDPELLFNLEIDLDGLHELTFGASVDVHSSLTLTGNYAKTWDKELVLYTWHFVPITIYVGPVPVVLVPSLELILGANGTINAGVVLSVSDDAYALARLGYAEGEWGNFSDYDNDFNFADPVLNGTATAKAYAGIRPKLELYGLAGVYGVVDAYLEAKADVNDDPWYELRGGLEGRLGIDAFGLTHEEPVFNIYHILDQAPGAFEPTTASPSYAAWLENGGGHIESLQAILPLADGGCIAAGDTFGDLLLLRFDPAGTVVWSRVLGTGSVNAMCWASDGDVIGVGSEIGDAMAMRFSPDGDIRWINRLGANAGTADELFAVQPLKFGGYLAAGTLGNEATFSDAWLAAFDEQGSLLSGSVWPDAGDGFLRTLVRLRDGSLFAAGQAPAGPGGGDGLLVPIAADGTPGAARMLRLYRDGEPQEDYWEWVTTAASNGVGLYLGGQTNRGGITQWAARLDSAGNAQWARLAGGGDFALTWDVNASCVAHDGGFVVAGTTGSGVGGGAFDGFALKYAASGDVSWATAFGGADNDHVSALALPAAGKGIFAVGRSASFKGPEDDGEAWTLRLTDTGTVFFAASSPAVSTGLSGSTAECTLAQVALGTAAATPTLDLESNDSAAEDFPLTLHVISEE